MTLTINSGAQQSPATSLSSSLAAGITTQVLKDVDELRELSSEWQQLWRQTPEASAFQTSEWIIACAVHGTSPDIHAMVLRKGSEPLAIFPTRLSSRGALSFIGADFSNYCGPVYQPAALTSVMTAWCNAVSADPQIRSVDLTGLRERSPFLSLLTQSAFPRWGKPVAVEMFTCPEVDLREGWDKLVHKHKSRQRANWRRKWESLAELGCVEFQETSDPNELAAAFPRLIELYDARWRGKRIRASFRPEQHRLQLEAAKALGARGLVRLSLIRLNGEVIAFAYAMRGSTQSTSYVLAHDAAFEVFSPGLLLLMKLLETAAARGDTSYDFSLGNVPYKAMWATGHQRVFSVLLGRGTTFTALKRRCWRAARSIPLLRRLKQEGFRGLGRGKAEGESLLDRPGLSAGSTGRWHVYRIGDGLESAPGLLLRPLYYSEMRALFSPRLLGLALDRHFRGDQALALELKGSVIGAIWRAAQHRRPTVTGGVGVDLRHEIVYYHPVAANAEDIGQVVLGIAGEQAILVAPQPLRTEGAKEIHIFKGDLRFRSGDRPLEAGTSAG